MLLFFSLVNHFQPKINHFVTYISEMHGLVSNSLLSMPICPSNNSSYRLPLWPIVYLYLQTFNTFTWIKLLFLSDLVYKNLVHAFFSNALLIIDDHDYVVAIRS